jgi:hypothetical protein
VAEVDGRVVRAELDGRVGDGAAPDDAVAAGLAGYGSRARFRVLFKVQEGQMDRLVGRLRRELTAQSGLTVRSFRYSQDRMSETLTMYTPYQSVENHFFSTWVGSALQSRPLPTTDLSRGT